MHEVDSTSLPELAKAGLIDGSGAIHVAAHKSEEIQRRIFKLIRTYCCTVTEEFSKQRSTQENTITFHCGLRLKEHKRWSTSHLHLVRFAFSHGTPKEEKRTKVNQFGKMQIQQLLIRDTRSCNGLNVVFT